MGAFVVKMSTTSAAPLADSERNEMITSGQSLLASGKRHLLVCSFPAAVSDLAESCEMLAKVHGETAPECGEAYYYYGKALLELSRVENQVLGNALQGVDMDAEEPAGDAMVEDPEKVTKDEKIEIEDKVAGALEENFETHDKIARAHTAQTEEGAMEEDDYNEEGKDAEMTDKTEGADKEKAENTEDEDPSNLQLAWEMLELAKVVYGKVAESGTGDVKTAALARQCEAYLGLGEVSLENENYSQAVADFTECLNRRQATLPPDSRSIAETHYQLGVAKFLEEKFEESETCLNKAKSVLEVRIVNLSKMETSENLAKEIEDLHTLVKEINEKINDHKVAEKAKSEGKGEGMSTGFSGGSDKPISSIGVKKSDLTGAKIAGTATVGSA